MDDGLGRCMEQHKQSRYVIQMPPGSANWAIGNRGEQALGSRPTFDPGPALPMLPQGIVESQGHAGDAREPLSGATQERPGLRP